ncbi:MAG: NTP transferase domain-containing protein [Candidatus Adiutrix sp.]|jgi:mannose-1-phosphate guanylyltransferase|nr:NTP transferase domain-containing protein [Candidatus Adiutrix sp.]
MIETAMILGAGLGTRLRPLSLLRPKPLFPVLNKTMLEWWAEFLSSAGVKRLVINAHYLAPMMLERIDLLARSFAGRLEILPSPEAEILGSGGGVRQAAALLGDRDFLVVNADIFSDFDLVKLARAHLADPGRLATLGLIERPETANVAVGEGGRILAFRRPEAAAGEISRQSYCGLMALSPAIFDLTPPGPSDIIEVFASAMAAGASVFGWLYEPAIWRDIGTAADYWDLNRSLAAGRSIIHSTARTEGARLSGWNVIGRDAVIQPGAAVENCVIWPDSVILGDASAKNAVAAGSAAADALIVFCDGGTRRDD